MSALGQKQTSAHVRGMSALPPKADIGTKGEGATAFDALIVSSGKRSLRGLDFYMREHRLQRLFIHLSLELMPIFECHGLLRRRPCTDFVGQPLQIRKFLPGAVAKHGGNKSCPSPDVHINDRVGVAEHVFLLAKACIENPGMSLRFKRITIDCVRNLFGSIVSEMH